MHDLFRAIEENRIQEVRYLNLEKGLLRHGYVQIVARAGDLIAVHFGMVAVERGDPLNKKWILEGGRPARLVVRLNEVGTPSEGSTTLLGPLQYTIQDHTHRVTFYVNTGRGKWYLDPEQVEVPK